MTLLKLIMCACLLFLGRQYIASEFVVFRRSMEGFRKRRRLGRIAIYSAALAAIASSILASTFIEDALIRLPLIAYFSTSMAALLIYRNLNGAHVHHRVYFDDDIIELLWRERSMAGDAVRAYHRQLLPVALPFLLVVAVLAAGPGADRGLSYPYDLLPLIVLACFAAAYPRGMLESFPSLATIPLRVVQHVCAGDLPVHVSLRPVELPVERSAFDKIIIVMDESIRGDYLGLGDADIDTTPFLRSLAGRVTNYGIALSGHNCSSYSRYLLRHGARPEDLPEAVHHGLSLAGPNIWQYAQGAGFRTVYIDGFSNEVRLHSGMTLEEAGFIDEVRRIAPAAPQDRDALVGRSLLEALRDPAPALIYVDKYGLHRPYDDKYPPHLDWYRSGSGASARDQLIASYKNGVRWCVDDFFSAIIPEIDFSRTVLLYTSDHGQNLMDTDSAISHCNCGDNVAPGEAFVPLFVMSGDEAIARTLGERQPGLKNRASHFDIFPTLLAFLGYDRASVAAAYGTGLFGEPSGLNRFLVSFKTRTRWVEAERYAHDEDPRSDDVVPSPGQAAEPVASRPTTFAITINRHVA